MDNYLESISYFLGYNSIYLTAFLVGILGGIHCFGMCGGVVGSLTLNLKVQTSLSRILPFQLFYNVGRISSYVFLGLLFGFLGQGLSNLAIFLPIQQVLLWVSGAFMIAIGLYLGGWWYGIVIIEKSGNRLWKKLLPFTQKFNQVQYLHQAYIYGLLWGWLPCGLVYSMLIMAMASGSGISGATTMMFFGLGTLPNLIFIGVFTFYLTKLSRNIWVRRFAGMSVILLGILQIYRAIML